MARDPNQSRTRPHLIVVAGLPATGKTTLARGLARELGLPLIGRDDLKEIMYDGLGWSDRAWSQRLGAVSYELLFFVARTMLASGVSLIVESNFDPDRAAPVLNGIAAETGARLAQVLCQADGPLLYERYLSRAGAPERHPGHDDLRADPELATRILQGKYEPLDLTGPLIVVNTNDLANADPRLVAGDLRTLLAFGYDAT